MTDWEIYQEKKRKLGDLEDRASDLQDELGGIESEIIEIESELEESRDVVEPIAPGIAMSCRRNGEPVTGLVVHVTKDWVRVLSASGEFSHRRCNPYQILSVESSQEVYKQLVLKRGSTNGE